MKRKIMNNDAAYNNKISSISTFSPQDEMESLNTKLRETIVNQYKNRLLKEVNSGLPDRVKGNKSVSPTQAGSRARSRPMKMENKESLTDDSGNLLLDVILAGSMKKDH